LKALIIFSGESRHPLKWLLRPGFRHVSVVVEDPYGAWIMVDASEGLPNVEIVGYVEEVVRERFEEAGYRVLSARQSTRAAPWPLALANCVGMVKSVLGINAPLTWTPYQLYCLILKQQEHAP